MTIPTQEKNVRAFLPVVRMMTGYMPLPMMRWLIKQGLARVSLPAGVTHEAVTVDGVPCEWLIPDNSPKDRVLLYLHGGGFILGWTRNHREMVAELAKKMGVRALAVDYRVAPEYPFPAPLDDCVTAYHWLLKQGIAAQNIVIAGDSAGGNLTLTTLMKLRDSGDPLPAAAACLSPVADMTKRDELFKVAVEPLLHPRATRIYLASYVAQNDPRNPLISPAYGDWRGLPPLLVHAGEDEFLKLDAVNIEKFAKEAGVDVRLEIYPRMWHVWQINLSLPQATQSLDDIAQFLRAHLGVLAHHPV